MYDTLYQISSGDWRQFEIGQNVTSQRVPYDYFSTMHYEWDTGTVNGEPTILPVNKSIAVDILGSAKIPTEYDYLHLNLLYCGGTLAIHS